MSVEVKFFIHPLDEPPTYPVYEIVVHSYRLAKEYILDATAEYDFSSSLIEEDLEVELKLESNRYFDLEVSEVNFTLNESTAVKSFMDTYAYDTSIIIGVQLLYNGSGEFWGCCKPKNIIYDPITETYSIEAYDWIKFLLDTKGSNLCPYDDSPTLERALLLNMKVFEGINIDVDTQTQTIDTSEYNSIINQVSVKEFIINLQKDFGAYMYYSGDKVLNFIKRKNTIGLYLNIDDIILESSFERTIHLKDFDYLFINDVNLLGGSNSSWAWISADNYYWVYEDGGEFYIYDSVTNTWVLALKNIRYLDLRQSLPEPNRDFILYPLRALGIGYYEDYKELLYNSKFYKCTINTLDIWLQREVKYKNVSYLVRSVKKNYLTETSEIEIVEKVL